MLARPTTFAVVSNENGVAVLLTTCLP